MVEVKVNKENNATTLLKNSLLKFYKKKENLDKVIAILERKTPYSRRTLEWACSNYFKKNNISITIDGKETNFFNSYKNQLDSFHKKKFDPFQRDVAGYPKFKLYYGKNNDKHIETTVGQLNFFRWCIECKVLDYVSKHSQAIKDDMKKYVKNTTTKETSSTSVIKERKKRKPLAVTIKKPVIKSTNIKLKF